MMEGAGGFGEITFLVVTCGANLPESTLSTTQTQTQHCELSPSHSLQGGFGPKISVGNSRQALLRATDKDEQPRLRERVGFFPSLKDLDKPVGGVGRLSQEDLLVANSLTWKNR